LPSCTQSMHPLAFLAQCACRALHSSHSLPHAHPQHAAPRPPCLVWCQFRACLLSAPLPCLMCRQSTPSLALPAPCTSTACRPSPSLPCARAEHKAWWYPPPASHHDRGPEMTQPASGRDANPSLGAWVTVEPLVWALGQSQSMSARWLAIKIWSSGIAYKPARAPLQTIIWATVEQNVLQTIMMVWVDRKFWFAPPLLDLQADTSACVQNWGMLLCCKLAIITLTLLSMLWGTWADFVFVADVSVLSLFVLLPRPGVSPIWKESIFARPITPAFHLT